MLIFFFFCDRIENENKKSGVFMFKAITLEVSLKPFKQTSEDYIRDVCYDKFIAVATNVVDKTPELDEDWTPIFDEIMGHGFVGEHKNGKLSFLMPFEKYL